MILNEDNYLLLFYWNIMHIKPTPVVPILLEGIK